MKLSLPKPMHGWRAFAGEVGVIVLGVVLALAAQQVAESVNDRREAAATRATLVDEIEALPGGFDADVVNAQVLLEQASADRGCLALASGMRYRYLVLMLDRTQVVSPPDIRV